MCRDADLMVGTAWSLAAGAAALAGLDSVAARVTLGLPFVLFWPGYSLAAALFPEPDRLHASQRIAMSVGLSIGITAVAAFALNYSPWGVRLIPIVSSLGGMVLLAAGTAAARRHLGERRHPGPAALAEGAAARWSRKELAARAPAGVLLMAAAGFAVALYRAAPSGTDAERFTEFYVVGPDGRADSYSTHLRAGDSASVLLGLVNEEGADSAYRIVAQADGGTRQVANPTLRKGDRWERTVALAPTVAGRDRDVQFLLYKAGVSAPYRRLHLRLVVEPALAVQPTPDRAPAAPAVAGASASPA
ncbi:MAG TPA: DUF1616 domain-containing protein, partial [Dehalococcoidia bacterium]|nr:DUF1616 domain-containing protein [Dehalococcoidia bacterium]